MILPLLGAGCVSGAATDAVCDGTRNARTDHAAALAASVDDLAVVTGARLIAMIDAGCSAR